MRGGVGCVMAFGWVRCGVRMTGGGVRGCRAMGGRGDSGGGDGEWGDRRGREVNTGTEQGRLSGGMRWQKTYRAANRVRGMLRGTVEG